MGVASSGLDAGSGGRAPLQLETERSSIREFAPRPSGAPQAGAARGLAAAVGHHPGLQRMSHPGTGPGRREPGAAGRAQEHHRGRRLLDRRHPRMAQGQLSDRRPDGRRDQHRRRRAGSTWRRRSTTRRSRSSRSITSATAARARRCAPALPPSHGDVVVIQDADLEYDPQDWAAMYDLIAIRKVADVVYGSRFHGRAHRSLYFHHYLANRLISLLFNVLYNQTLSDIETCYKMMTARGRALAATCRPTISASRSRSAPTSRASASCASTSSASPITAAATTRARRSTGRTASRRSGTC